MAKYAADSVHPVEILFLAVRLKFNIKITHIEK